MRYMKKIFIVNKVKYLMLVVIDLVYSREIRLYIN